MTDAELRALGGIPLVIDDVAYWALPHAFFESTVKREVMSQEWWPGSSEVAVMSIPAALKARYDRAMREYDDVQAILKKMVEA